MTSSTDKPHSNAIIAGAVAFYFIISISTVFANKYILNSNEYEFPAMTMTLVQLVFAVVLQAASHPLFPNFIPKPEFSSEKAKQIAPLSLLFIGMLVFNNLCLQVADVLLYQIARSLSICFTALFVYVLHKQTTSLNVLYCCGVVLAGYIIGVIGKANLEKVDFTWLGVFYGLLSSAFVALYGIFVKSKMQLVSNQWVLMLYNNILSSILLTVICLVTGDFGEALASPHIKEPRFIFVLIVSSILGYLINVATFLQINVTSSLTHTISGTCKACVQSLLGAVVFGDKLDAVSVLGTFISIFGSMAYTIVKGRETSVPKSSEQVATSSSSNDNSPENKV
ncbi:hypothetical protein FDP41_006423 [Naegleria fowleri]|uniref:Sugar phosphate transporter domain-containing protein n=1 Tax=Naegleria fowleri TaxID=5763 RepID=A0A6A5BIY5_NAEFO|nr:uncharacterized protein FDP41_006423 [Naegleria fowleri]KAF0974391.1 hypothetical protein FDP41_006423 [Naegleria fowleri]CAG4719391.1 unnamed protein product [Naegleria fowleri]